MLRGLDTRPYAALLAERGLLALLGSRAIELAPEPPTVCFLRVWLQRYAKLARARWCSK